jgi:hypothetical protein
MNTTAYLFDLLKIILPALIVAGSIFYLIQQYLEKEQQRRLIELRLEATKTTLPLRLQALERVTLLLERITPNNILIRLNSAGQTAPDYYRLLLQEIRAEYEHNLSQQLYMSPETWAEVKSAKEHILTVINKSYQGLAQPQQARGTELAKRVLETLINEEADPTERALHAVKREAAGLFQATMLTLTALATIVSSFGEMLGAPADLLPTFGCNKDFARPEVQVHYADYHFIIVERGQELQRSTTSQLEQVLFWIFEAVTFSMAGEYELAHRIEGQDFRIVLFSRQIELLELISPDFADRQRLRYQKILPRSRV